MPSFFPAYPDRYCSDQRGGKTVETGGHRGVRGEEIARAGNRESGIERLPGRFHEVAGAFEHGEGRVPFVQVTDLGLQAERAEQPPAADPEEQLLLKAQFRSASVEFAGDPAMGGEVRRIVAIQQIQLHPAHLDLPGAQPNRVSRQRDLQP